MPTTTQRPFNPPAMQTLLPEGAKLDFRSPEYQRLELAAEALAAQIGSDAGLAAAKAAGPRFMLDYAHRLISGLYPRRAERRHWDHVRRLEHAIAEYVGL